MDKKEIIKQVETLTDEELKHYTITILYDCYYGREDPKKFSILYDYCIYRNIGIVNAILDELKKNIELVESTTETNKVLAEKLIRLSKLTQHALFDYDFDSCEYCRHYLKCEGKDCSYYEEGHGMTDDKGNKCPDMKWTCMDFNYGTCRKYEEESNTFCKECKNGSNWEWADSFN